MPGELGTASSRRRAAAAVPAACFHGCLGQWLIFARHHFHINLHKERLLDLQRRMKAGEISAQQMQAAVGALIAQSKRRLGDGGGGDEGGGRRLLPLEEEEDSAADPQREGGAARGGGAWHRIGDSGPAAGKKGLSPSWVAFLRARACGKARCACRSRHKGAGATDGCIDLVYRAGLRSAKRRGGGGGGWAEGSPVYRYEIACDGRACVFALLGVVCRLLRSRPHRQGECWPSGAGVPDVARSLTAVRATASLERRGSPYAPRHGAGDTVVLSGATGEGITDGAEALEAFQRVDGALYAAQAAARGADAAAARRLQRFARRFLRAQARRGASRGAGATAERAEPAEAAGGEGGGRGRLKKQRKRQRRKQLIGAACVLQRELWPAVRRRIRRRREGAAAMVQAWWRRTWRGVYLRRIEAAAKTLQRSTRRWRRRRFSSDGGLLSPGKARPAGVLYGGIGRTYYVMPHSLTLSMVCPPALHLTHEISSFVSSIESFNAKVARARSRILQQLRMSVQQLFPCAQLHLFGSVASGLAVPSSDLDCYVAHHSGGGGLCNTAHMGDWCGFCMAQFPPQRQLELLREELYRQPWVSDLVLVRSESMPVLRFLGQPYAWSARDEDGLVTCTVDLTCGMSENHSGNAITRLVKAYALRFPPLVPLVLTLKQFLKERRLCDPYHGGLGSFALTLLAIRYLQMEQRPLDSHAGGAATREARPSGSRFDELKGMLERTHHSSNSGEHLLGFLNFYGHEFERSWRGLDIRDGGKLLALSRGYPRGHPANRFVIANPLRPAQNVADGVFNIGAVFEAFRAAAKSLDEAIKEYEWDCMNPPPQDEMRLPPTILPKLLKIRWGMRSKRMRILRSRTFSSS